MSLDNATLLGAQQALQLEAQNHQSLEAKAKKLLEPKQKYEVQMLENKAVFDELKLIEDDEENKVYKQVGPVLLRVPLDEARANVQKRLEFMESKVKGIEAELTAVVTEQQRSRQKFMQLQAMIRQAREQAMAAAQAQMAAAQAAAAGGAGAPAPGGAAAKPAIAAKPAGN
jgi:prefoldin beta subunit